MKWRHTVFLLAVLTSLVRAEVSLVATGSVWKYRADQVDLGTAWRSNSFDDAAWLSGPAQFGWGEGDERTALFSGPSTEESPSHLTFAKHFPSPIPSPLSPFGCFATTAS